MPSFINTNLASLNAQRNLNTSQSALATSLQRLSSGLRINSAKDDAAGMAISSRMTAQINGNNQATRNANDGISLAQTAEGDLAQIGINLQRMRDLAVQSANATNSASDRASLNAEVQALAAEIDRVSQNSSFNGVKLLDGSFTAQTFHVGAGATANDNISISSIASARTSQLGGAGATTAATTTGTAVTGVLTAGALTLNSVSVGATVAGAAPGQSNDSAIQVAAAINAVAASSGVTATANATVVTGTVGGITAYNPIAANAFQINGVNVGAVAAGGNAAGQGANVAAAINLVSTQTGVTASANATTGALTLTAADGRDIQISLPANTKAAFVAATGLASTAVSIGQAFTNTQTVVSGTIGGSVVSGTTTTAAVGTFTVDGKTLFTNSILAGATGTLITAAQLDTAWTAFAAANAGYTLTGTFAAGTAQITKSDGTAIVLASAMTGGAGGAITAQTAGASFLGTTTAGNAVQLQGTTSVASGTIGGSVVSGVTTTAAVGTFTVDGKTLFTNSILAGATGTLITAAQLDTAWTAFAAANAGYTLTGTFAAGTAQITKSDGTAIVLASVMTGGAGGAITAQTASGTGFLGTTTAANVDNHGTVTLKSSNAAGIVLGGGNPALAGFTAGTTAATTVSTVSAISAVDISTAAGATSALSAIDGAIDTVNSSRASLGAYQNRFASVVTSLQTTSENLTASRSRILDTDFAAETAQLTRNQILQQAGTAMLAQANMLPQSVLTLLK